MVRKEQICFADRVDRCQHYFLEDFSIGPPYERWYRCMFCGHTKRGHTLRRKDHE